jgi:hypothetical protein
VPPPTSYSLMNSINDVAVFSMWEHFLDMCYATSINDSSTSSYYSFSNGNNNYNHNSNYTNNNGGSINTNNHGNSNNQINSNIQQRKLPLLNPYAVHNSYTGKKRLSVFVKLSSSN